MVWVLVHLLLTTVGFGLLAVGGVAAVIGGSIAATGIAGEVLVLYMWRTEQIQAGLENLTRFGLERAFESRSATIRAEYHIRLSRMNDGLDVLGFGLSAFLQDYRDHFEGWRQRARIRILLLDPQFPNESLSYANQRDLEERQELGRIDTDVKNFLSVVQPFVGLNDEGKGIEVRLFTCLPSINIFRIDDEMFWGPYLIHVPSRNTPTLLVRRSGILFERYQSHFDEFWNDERLSRPAFS